MTRIAPPPLTDILVHLRQIPFLTNLSETALNMLALQCPLRVLAQAEILFREGDPGGSLYVVLDGEIEITHSLDATLVTFGSITAGDFFGEMCVFEKQPRSATVRAIGQARVLTVDKKNLLRQITVDPTLAFNLLEKMSARIRTLNQQVAWLTGEQENKVAPK